MRDRARKDLESATPNSQAYSFYERRLRASEESIQRRIASGPIGEFSLGLVPINISGAELTKWRGNSVLIANELRRDPQSSKVHEIVGVTFTPESAVGRIAYEVARQCAYDLRVLKLKGQPLNTAIAQPRISTEVTGTAAPIARVAQSSQASGFSQVPAVGDLGGASSGQTGSGPQAGSGAQRQNTAVISRPTGASTVGVPALQLVHIIAGCEPELRAMPGVWERSIGMSAAERKHFDENEPLLKIMNAPTAEMEGLRAMEDVSDTRDPSDTRKPISASDLAIKKIYACWARLRIAQL